MNEFLLEPTLVLSGPEDIADRQPLNPLDQALCCIDRSIRGIGYPGFETQMLIWLAGRVDVGLLRVALERLSRRRPTITARLVVHGGGEASSYWQLTHEAAGLNEIDVSSTEPEAVLACAEGLLSTPHDPAIEPPVRFSLLRCRNGSDVFLMQYNHVLMDQSASVVLLRELNELTDLSHRLSDAPQPELRHVLRRWLRRIPHADRRAAARAGLELQGRTLRGRAALLGTGEEDKPRSVKLRIASRTLDRELTRAIQARSGQLCGLPSMSMTILACAFRAIWQLGPAERNANRNYIAGIGMDMNLRREGRPVLQNLLSVVPVFARPDELMDRDELVRALCRQMRDRLEAKIDVAMIRFVHAFQRKPRHVRWVVEHLLRWTYSLWYAYFGSLDSVGRQFCGVLIEKVQYVGPTWSPLGLSMLANRFQGRLHFQATYDPDLVDTPLAEAFLDFVLDDLASFADGE